MGVIAPSSQLIKRLVVFVVLDIEYALLLEEHPVDKIYVRLGLVGFKDEETLDRYLERYEEKAFIIQDHYRAYGFELASRW